MFTKTYYITAGDMDVNYRMTPGAALLYFQDAFASYLSDHHIAAFDLVKEDKIWVISDFDLHFKSFRALWTDRIEVSLQFSEITSCRAYIQFAMKVAGNDLIFAEGESCWVTLDAVTRHPCNVSEILERADARTLGLRHRGKVNPKPQDPVLKVNEKHNVNFTDLDFNGHVCNRSYMAMAMSTIPIDFIKISNPLYVHIKFVKESFIGDMLDINVFHDRNEGNILFHDIRNSADEQICTVYSEWKTDEEDLSRDVAELIRR